VYGMYGHSTSAPGGLGTRDMVKGGVETIYSILPWVALGDRIDYVVPVMGDSSKSFGTLTQKVIIRSDWNARETLVLQYSGWILGDNVKVNGDNRLMNYTSAKPDQHMLAIFGTMWW
jgi:hypothetical protein